MAGAGGDWQVSGGHVARSAIGLGRLLLGRLGLLAGEGVSRSGKDMGAGLGQAGSGSEFRSRPMWSQGDLM